MTPRKTRVPDFDIDQLFEREWQCLEKQAELGPAAQRRSWFSRWLVKIWVEDQTSTDYKLVKKIAKLMFMRGVTSHQEWLEEIRGARA